MKKDVRMIDIAKQLDISVVTVSNALNDKEGVSAQLRERVKQTAEKIGYKYTVNNKITSKIENRNIGILISERFGSKGSFYWELCQEVSKELLKNNLFAINETLSRQAENDCVLPKIISGNKISGLIVLGQIKHKYIDLLINVDIPLVFLDFYDKHYNVDTVVTDNFYGMYLLTDYLLQNGHKNIGFVGNIKATSSIHDRFLGYLKALMEDDVQINTENLFDDRDENNILIKNFAMPEKLPTAFVCNCDETAFRVITFLKSRGVRVPEDVSIVGFDNYVMADVCDPPLTTVEVNLKMMAETTVEIILKKLEDNNYSAGRKIILGKLIIRDSVKNIKSE